jgi:hypothetical protein
VVVAAGLTYGIVMARRMSKCWPGAKDLSGADRVAVTRVARAGGDIEDARLAPAVIDYSRAVHNAAERFQWWWWWLIVLLSAVALVTAIADTIFSPAGEAVVSWLYFAFVPVEAFWWPRRQAELLARAQRAERSAGNVLAQLESGTPSEPA